MILIHHFNLIASLLLLVVHALIAPTPSAPLHSSLFWLADDDEAQGEERVRINSPGGSFLGTFNPNKEVENAVERYSNLSRPRTKTKRKSPWPSSNTSKENIDSAPSSSPFSASKSRRQSLVAPGSGKRDGATAPSGLGLQPANAAGDAAPTMPALSLPSVAMDQESGVPATSMNPQQPFSDGSLMGAPPSLPPSLTNSSSALSAIPLASVPAPVAVLGHVLGAGAAQNAADPAAATAAQAAIQAAMQATAEAAATAAKAQADEDSAGVDEIEEREVFATYEPVLVADAFSPPPKEHPSQLVETASLSAVNAPATSFPISDTLSEVANADMLSAAQLESVITACESHSWHIRGGLNYRAGFALGDGAGVGKGRQVAGMVSSNVHIIT